jgi:hypothetical protein
MEWGGFPGELTALRNIGTEALKAFMKDAEPIAQISTRLRISVFYQFIPCSLEASRRLSVDSPFSLFSHSFQRKSQLRT